MANLCSAFVLVFLVGHFLPSQADPLLFVDDFIIEEDIDIIQSLEELAAIDDTPYFIDVLEVLILNETDQITGVCTACLVSILFTVLCQWLYTIYNTSTYT